MENLTFLTIYPSHEGYIECNHAGFALLDYGLIKEGWPLARVATHIEEPMYSKNGIIQNIYSQRR